MDRIASLRLAARQLRASLFRSLPLGFRLAHAIVRASGTGSALGAMIGATFLKAGVMDMPDPGPRWNPNSPNAADTLPSGYYADFGEKLLRAMIRKWGDVEFVEDGIMSFLLQRTVEKVVRVDEHTPQHRAQGLMFTAVDNFLTDKSRTEHGRAKKHTPLHRTDDEGEETEIDFDDPGALTKFEHHVTDAKIREIKREIAKIVPWAPAWLDMLMEGEQETDIIGDPKTGRPSALAEQMGLDTPYLTAPSGTPMSYPMWANRYKKKIVEKMKDIYAR